MNISESQAERLRPSAGAASKTEMTSPHRDVSVLARYLPVVHEGRVAGGQAVGSRGSCELGIGRRLLVAAFVAIVAGCSTGGVNKDMSAEIKAEAVKGRAAARWAAIIQGDLDKAYSFMSPASRSVVTLAAFKSQVRRPFRSARVDGVDCGVELCKVRLTVSYDHKLMKDIPTPILESWILDREEFWYVSVP